MSEDADPDAGTIGRFYSRIARPYDRFATSLLFRAIRQDAVDALELHPGASVLEIGCGTGGNLPLVDRALDGEGKYVGVDLSRGMLEQAAARRVTIDADVVQGDGTSPPVTDGFDAVLVTFVNGVLADPPAAVKTWVERLAPGGRIVMVDAAARRNRYTPIDIGVRAFVVLVAPPGTRRRHGRSANEVLIDRIESAHAALADDASVEREWTRWAGLVRLVAARKA